MDQRFGGLSRRRFLQGLLALSTATLARGIGGCGAEDDAVEPPVGGADPVVVIGAGFSGLTVAQTLRAFGIPAVVLEARDRLGGRTWTADVGGVPVDLGGAWIHGTVGNPVACFATAHGIGWREAEVISANLSVFDPHKGFLPGTFLLDLAEITGSFAAALDELRRVLGPSASLADATVRFLDDQGLVGDQRRYADFAIRQGLGELFYAGPASDTSLAAFYADEEFAGGNQFPDGGYVRLVTLMAAGLDVRLNTEVTGISYDANGVVVGTGDGPYRGSHAVVTVPLGVLKAQRIRFSPPLPAAKRAAIGRLEMGNFEKVVLRFDDAFWLAARRRQVVYLSATYGEFPIYFDLTRFVGEPTLLCFYGGVFAREAAALSDSAITVRVLAILAEIFQRSVPAPTHVARTRWAADPYALGSYSFIPVGAGFDDMRALAEPVAGRVLFAGEATDPLHYGTVAAAMISGIREAERLRQAAAVPLPADPPPVLTCAL